MAAFEWPSMEKMLLGTRWCSSNIYQQGLTGPNPESYRLRDLLCYCFLHTPLQYPIHVLYDLFFSFLAYDDIIALLWLSSLIHSPLRRPILAAVFLLFL